MQQILLYYVFYYHFCQNQKYENYLSFYSQTLFLYYFYYDYHFVLIYFYYFSQIHFDYDDKISELILKLSCFTISSISSIFIDLLFYSIILSPVKIFCFCSNFLLSYQFVFGSRNNLFDLVVILIYLLVLILFLLKVFIIFWLIFEFLELSSLVFE